MFIIQDAQFSHDLTLLCPLLHHVTAHGDVHRASGITLTKNGITVQSSVLQPFLCASVQKHHRPCSVCMCGCSTLASLYVCMKGTTYGRLSHWFNPTVSNQRLWFSAAVMWMSRESRQAFPLDFLWYLKYLSTFLNIRKLKSCTTVQHTSVLFIHLVLISLVIFFWTLFCHI